MSNSEYAGQHSPAITLFPVFRQILLVLAIAGMVFLIYSNTFDSPFQFDDYTNIVNSPAIKDFNYFGDTTMVDGTAISNALKPLFRTRYMGYLSFAANYALDGLNVRGFHLVNIFIHSCNAVLLYWLMTLIFRAPFGEHRPDYYASRMYLAVFTALLFAVHPIQTQAVTYIVQRFTSLATLFYLLSFVMYVKFRYQQSAVSGQRYQRYALYVVSLISAALAMKTKEFSVTLPVMLAMYEYMFYEGRMTKRVLYLIPFFIATLLIPLALIAAGNSLGDMSWINEEAVKMSGASGSISRADYLFTQFRVIVTYIRLLLFPVHQNIDYDYPVYNSFFDPAVVLSFVFLLVLFSAGIYLFRLSKRTERNNRFWLRLISFGIFWFFLTLFPESGVVPIIDVIFEHRVYLPSVGFFIALTAAIGAGLQRWGGRAKYTGRVIVFGILLLVIILSSVTYTRNSVWKSRESLWENAVAGSPNKARPHYNLGFAFTAQGRVDEAIKEYTTALKLNPDYLEAHYNLGSTYMGLGRNAEALEEFRRVMEHNPDYLMTRQFVEFLLKRSSGAEK